MTGFILIGVLALVTGVLFLVAPQILIRLGESFNRVVAFDNKTFRYRISMGIVLIAAGIFFFLMAWYFSHFSIG